MSATTGVKEVSTTESDKSSAKGKNVLQTSKGSTSIADTVVTKIAGIAAREVDGVYDLGGTASRMVGKLRETLPGSDKSLGQGISVEVGDRQASVDVGIVAEYGVAIQDLAEGIRRNVISSVESMTGLEVTAVDVTVYDVHVETDDDDSDEPKITRV